MSAKTVPWLVDTNVLVHAYTVADPLRHEYAVSCIDRLWHEGTPATTLQNLCEFYAVVTSRVARPIPSSRARELVDGILASLRWTKLDRGVSTVRTAMEIAGRNGVHFWDALIAATMLEHDVTTIVTENERDFKKIPGLRVVNPFK